MATPLPPPAGAEDRLRDIGSVTDAALSHLGADELLTALLVRVKEIFDADTAAVLLLDNSGRQLIATAAAAWRRKSARVSGSRSARVSLAVSPPGGRRSSWAMSITATC